MLRRPQLVALIYLVSGVGALSVITMRSTRATPPLSGSLGSRLGSVALIPFNAVGKSAKAVVSSSAGLAVLSSPSWLPMYYICGALLNALLSKIIKRIVRQPRPATSKKGGYGMPSSHTHLLFYFLTITTFLSREYYSASYLSLALPLALGAYAVTAAYWRVVDGLHTLPQTLVGGALGVGTGTLIYTKQADILAAMFSPATRLEPVPLALKLSVMLFGGLTLYKNEIGRMLIKFKSKSNKI